MRRLFLYIVLFVLFLLVLLFCGRTVIAATEPLSLDTKTHKVVSPLTIDYAGVTILNWPVPGAVSSVFGRTGAVVAQSADYTTFYAPLAAALPTGGTTGQVLTKTSATNYAANWQTPTTPTPAPTPPVSSVFTRTGAVTAQSGDYAAFYQPLGSYEVPLTFSQSLSRVTNTVTLNGDSASPGTSKYYGTDSGGSKGFFTLPTFTAPVTSVFTRTGAVTAQSGDYSISQITGANATNWDTAYTDRMKWDGGATGLVAATGRTSLGASTLGSNIFTIGNNSLAQTAFMEIGSTNIPTLKSASGMLSDLGGEPALGNPTSDGMLLSSTTAGVRSWIAPGGTGTVTSFSAGDLSPLFTTTETNVTTTPALSFTLSSAAAGTVFANNSLSAAAPAFINNPRIAAISNLTTNGFVKTGGGSGALSVDTNTYLTGNQTITLTGDATGSGTTSIATTVAAKLPTGGSIGQVLTKTSGTNYAANWQTPATGPVLLVNSSVANQTGFATDTYVTGSNVTYTAGSWAAGGTYHCILEVSKTAAGTATPIVTLRSGTGGTVSDTAEAIFTFTAGTAATDDATVEVLATIRTTGASGTGAGICKIVTSGGGFIGGTTAWTQVKSNSSVVWDTTTFTNLGISLNGGSGFQGTVRLVSAEYKQ